MAKTKLTKIKNTIEDFFYKIQVNIALYAVMDSTEYTDFRDAMDKAIKKQILYFAKIQNVNRVIGVSKAIDADIINNIKKIWTPITKFVSKTNIKDYLSSVLAKSGPTLYNTVNSKDEFSPDNHKAILKYIQKRPTALVKLIDDTTISIIASAITKGYEQGDSHYQIAKLVRSSADRVSAYRAEIIAENEAALLIGELTIDVYKKDKVKFKKFVTARDERVCPICVGDESVGTIAIDETFPSGVLAPPAHVACRCFLLPMEKK